MKALYPVLSDFQTLPRRVMVVAPHADDEVFGCGGMLAMHAARGDAIRIVIMTDGAAGDPGALAQGDLVEKRASESVAAGRELGVTDYRFLGLPDGTLSTCDELADRVRSEVEEFEPELVYGPSPQEMHPDHRATSRGLIAALTGGAERRVFLYGVNAQTLSGVLFDTTPVWDKKRAAIECFTSQLQYHDLVGKARAVDHSRTVNIEDASIEYLEGFADLTSSTLGAYEARVSGLLDVVFEPGHGLGSTALSSDEGSRLPGTTAVISTWNKVDVVLENLASLKAQTLPFASIVVVDNASSDGTAEAVARNFPDVRLTVMPHDKYGACETFNIGFASVTTPYVAILDDDITLPPEWLEKATRRMLREPESTAVVSSKIVEPGMPEAYRNSEALNSERYMSTFRGCGSLAKTAALREAGFYDERLFIYGNERDLTCRLLNRGYRVLQYPDIETYHKTPFGIQMGKRSLFFHARNAWLSMLKYAPLEDLFRLPILIVTKVLMRSEAEEAQGTVTDATGTIGIGRSIKDTPGAFWILCKAGFSVLYNLPYCMKRREPVTAEDFELPLN